MKSRIRWAEYVVLRNYWNSNCPSATEGIREYTQVIIKEADRLQTLVDRLSRRTGGRTSSAT